MTIKSSLYIVSAPSGAGKTSLVEALIASTPGIVRSVSHTTRASRPGEQDGVDYYFVDPDRFEAMVAEGRFLEHAEVFGNYYGTSVDSVDDSLADGDDVILVIDWQGAENVRGQRPDAQSIFIVPPSLAALRQRLSARGQDDDEVVEGRLAQARDEIAHYQDFDYLVVNDRFDEAEDDLRHIVLARRLRCEQQAERQRGLLGELLGG
jgi:guanylate kinase